jgi:hypothetical protein
MAKRKPRSEQQVEAAVRAMKPEPGLEPGDAVAIAALRMLGEHFPAVVIIFEQRADDGEIHTGIFRDRRQVSDGHCAGMIHAAAEMAEGE